MDEKSASQIEETSTTEDFPQQIAHKGSESMPSFSPHPPETVVQNETTEGSGNVDYCRNSFVARRSNNYLSTESNANFSGKNSKSFPHEKALIKEAVQIGSDYSVAFCKGQTLAGKVSPPTKQRQGFFPPNASGSTNYRRDERMWNNGYDRSNCGDRPRRKEGLNTSSELARGPRFRSIYSGSATKIRDLGFRACREGYNKSDFQTDYEDSRFFVIKSYSEDDVHKSIKYCVWASTPKGNMKLDAAFHEAEEKSIETGIQCPIFLFFSVNGSGQFVGIAEMIGPVDFNKNMDFWQAEIWNGFFPVKWHIIKDVPNGQLRHIGLDNNDDRDVTYTRDTHEIGVKAGLAMLCIFKNYVMKTSLLDDFSFYESREKCLLMRRRNSKPQNPFPAEAEYDYNNMSVIMHENDGKRQSDAVEKAKRCSESTSSLQLEEVEGLTNNINLSSLSLNES